MFSYDYGEGFY